MKPQLYQHGISYIEVLVATLLIAVTLVPALDALGPGIQGSALHEKRARVQYALQGKMEQVLTESFAVLDLAATQAGSATTPTTYSDSFAPDITRNVYIWRYDVDDADGDGDVFTGGENDLLWIRIALSDGSQSLQTLLSIY